MALRYQAATAERDRAVEGDLALGKVDEDLDRRGDAPIDLPPLPDLGSGHRTLHRFVPCAVVTTAFAVLTLAVRCSPRPFAADLWLHEWLRTHRTSGLTSLALAVTSTGNSTVLIPAAFTAAFVAARGAVRPRLLLSTSVAVVLVLGVGIRLDVSDLVARARPPQSDWAGYAHGYAFPSGHSTAAAMTAGLLVWVAATRLTGRTRGIVVGLIVFWGVTVGLTRAYLGVHWPTDVLGAWLLAVAWLSIARASAHALAARHPTQLVRALTGAAERSGP